MTSLRKRIASAVAILTAATAIGACGGGEPEPLSVSEVAAQSQSGTLLLVGKSSGVQASSGASGIQYTCSAWLYDAEAGLVVTNAHCIGAPQIQVGQDSTSLQAASVVAVDNAHDLAVVRTGAIAGAEELPVADAAPVQGDAVYALGYPSNGKPNGLTTPYQASEGTVSATEGVQVQVSYDAFASFWESVGVQNDNAGVVLNDLVQTTAATTHGGSGGPVVNDAGEVVGVTVAGSTEGEQNDAVSHETLTTALPALAEGTSTAYLGLSLSAVPTEAAQLYGVDGFLLVGSIVRNSPIDQQTDQARLLSLATRRGLFLAVVEVNGQPVETQQQLVNELSTITSGQEVRLTEFAIDFRGNSVKVGVVSFTAP
jgi:S1-C subfamily serine protease